MGGPNNTYQWQVNGTNLNNETLQMLRVLNITAESGGEYTCVVSNPAGSHKASTFLFVYPYFLSHPDDVEVTLGSALLLICDAVGFPSPQYLWQRTDGMQIMGTTSIERRVLFITAGSGDGGEYFCVAFGRGTRIQSHNAIISVAGNVSTYMYVRTNIAETIQFCFSFNVKEKLHNGVIKINNWLPGSFTSFQVASTLYKPLFNKGLVMLAYNCGFLHIPILVPPVAVLTPINQTFSRGDTALFQCTSVGGPIITYQWQVNGTNLNNETLQMLRVFNITADSGGEYTCVVSNPTGSHKSSTFLFVYPYFLSQPGDVQVSLGSMILLTCDAVGFPNPEYLWTRADGRIIRSDINDGRILKITDVWFGDGGNYFCYASGRGMSYVSQDLMITGINY
jgi:hypothetical protein